VEEKRFGNNEEKPGVFMRTFHAGDLTVLFEVLDLPGWST